MKTSQSMPAPQACMQNLTPYRCENTEGQLEWRWMTVWILATAMVYCPDMKMADGWAQVGCKKAARWHWHWHWHWHRRWYCHRHWHIYWHRRWQWQATSAAGGPFNTHLTDAPCRWALDSSQDSVFLVFLLFVFGLGKLGFALKGGTALGKGCYNLFSCMFTG